mmetsp:Transcript_57338/g.153257  ORF Transcript_57338/g.153257 Transcript_57338/m.153257 type:complete len:113 (+) Transcript_57338:23-361(+)
MHPVIQALSPRHLAVQVSPFRQDGSSCKHALVWSEQALTRQFWSTSDVSRPPPYLADSSFSAHTGLVKETKADKSPAMANPVHTLPMFRTWSQTWSDSSGSGNWIFIAEGGV